MAGLSDPPPPATGPGSGAAAPAVPDPEAGLTSTQREALATFRAVTEAESTPAAVAALRAAQWNVQDAIEAHFGGSSSRSVPPAPTPPPPSSGPGVVAPAGPRRPRWLLLLFAPIRTLVSLFRRLAGIAARILGGPGAALAAAPGATDAARFRSFYGERHGGLPDAFFDGTYLEALAAAQAQARFLLVYLHSEGHPDTAGFCARVLADPRFPAAAAVDFVLWGAGVTQADGAAAQSALRAPGFPYIAVVQPPRATVRPNAPRPPLGPAGFGRVLSVRAARGAAQLDGASAAAWVVSVRQRHARLLDSVREARAARDRDRRLIEEQNAEYARSLEADRERERERTLKAERAEQAERAEREAGEQEEKVAREREERRRRKKEALGDEVESGPGVCKVMLRLPDGTRVNRRFAKEDALEKVFDWAEVNQVDIEVACLVTSYPRKRLRYPEDAGMTINDAGLFPSAMLLLEERGEDE